MKLKSQHGSGREERAAEEAARAPQSLPWVGSTLQEGSWAFATSIWGARNLHGHPLCPSPRLGIARGHRKDRSSRCFAGAKVEQAKDAVRIPTGVRTPLLHGEARQGLSTIPFFSSSVLRFVRGF